MLKGLEMVKSNPLPFTSHGVPDMAMIGVFGLSEFRMHRATSMPSMSGMRISVITKSNDPTSNIRRPSDPPDAVSTLYPYMVKASEAHPK